MGVSRGVRIGRFLGIVIELGVRGLLSRHNFRAAWIQSRRGWQDVVSAVDLDDEEFEAWLEAME